MAAKKDNGGTDGKGAKASGDDEGGSSLMSPADLRAALKRAERSPAACAVALIDRVIHHAELITIEGDSFRRRVAQEARVQQKAKKA